MIKRQESMVLSQYKELYELIIPMDNLHGIEKSGPKCHFTSELSPDH